MNRFGTGTTGHPGPAVNTVVPQANHAAPVLRRALLGVCAAVIAPVGLVLAQDDSRSRIEAVTLSSGGLAEIRRSIAATGGDELTFDVPLDQVDDILKSLLIYDPAGGIAAITLDGPLPVEETFRGLPFTPEDMSALPRLLGTLQGIPVRASSGGRTVEGMVLGVDSEPRPEDDPGQASLLSVMTEEGQVAVLRLRSDTQLEILDDTMRDKLRAAAAISGRGRVEDMRTISIALDGSGARDVRLDYVVPAPVWKTAHRLILDAEGVARLQAWAVIENVTGEAWSDVVVTLSSSAPVTLSQQLHQRYWHERIEVPVLAQTITPPRPDRFGEMGIRSAGALADQKTVPDFMRTETEAAPAPAAAQPSAPRAQAEAAEGETAATYRLPSTVDLPAGQTLSVPFIDAELTAERIALFQPERGGVHPISALRLENSTGASLPPGIVTVYASHEEGYAGDAQLPFVPEGESRIVSFAADRKIEVMTERGREETVYRATLAEGVLHITGITRSETIYTIEGAQDAPRSVIIEHPRRMGWSFSSEALEASTPTHHRLRAEVEAGGSAAVLALHERIETESIALLDTDTATLLHWSGRITSPETAELLAELAEHRKDIARAEAGIAARSRELEGAAASQARIRENLAAVPDDSTLAQRYLSQLEEQEDRIAELEARQRDAERSLRTKREAFVSLIGDL